MKRRAWCLYVVMCFSVMTAANASQLKNLRLTQTNNTSSLYLSINGPFTHKLFTLTNPYRVVVDLTGADLAVNLNQLPLKNALIQKVRAGKPNATTLRVVVELSHPVVVHSSPWQSQGLKLDLIGGKQTAVLTKPHKPPVKMNVKPQTSQVKSVQQSILPKKQLLKNSPVYQNQPLIAHQNPIKARSIPPASLRSVVVVLDAGHGGKDPGAKGPHRTQEKDVVLAITLRLKKLIDSQPGMRAVLTRRGDYYVGLRERLDIARKYNGDIFVAIHADAFNNPHSNGASVFALSQGGATSEAARWIAEKENYSELGGVNLGDLDDQNGIVRSVLIDLSQTATINSSLQMGGRVLSQLGQFTRLHNYKVEQARFMVLKSPDIPSILVETGFISNPREERNLTSAAYQDRLSRAIFQGIKGYFWENPPHGSRIEAMTS